MPPKAPPNSDDDKMSWVSHLIELRQRLVKSLILPAILLLVTLPFANTLYEWLAHPLIAQLPNGSSMIATQIAAPFLTPFKFALIITLFASVPWIFYQLWQFITPGLYTHEKRLIIPLLCTSILLFYLGIAFAYFIVFKLVFKFFLTIGPQSVALMPDIHHYLNFTLKMFFAFGIAFELPVALLLLLASRVTTHQSLSQKRPYVIIGILIAAMLLTPPDVISQLLLAIPMWLLFEGGLLLAKLLNIGTPSKTS